MKINLAEDEAGTLYMWREGGDSVICGFERLEGGETFAADAPDFDAPLWDMERYDGESARNLMDTLDGAVVAVYQDGAVEVVGKPFAAARIYLGPDAPNPDF